MENNIRVFGNYRVGGGDIDITCEFGRTNNRWVVNFTS